MNSIEYLLYNGLVNMRIWMELFCSGALFPHGIFYLLFAECGMRAEEDLLGAGIADSIVLVRV